MKQLIVWSLIGLVFVMTGCSKKESSTKKTADMKPQATKSLTDLLPENTEVLLKFNSIETVYTHFSITEDSVFGKPVPDIEDMQQVLGINPFKLEDLKSVGIDTQQPLAIALTDILVGEADLVSGTGNTPHFTGLILLPVIDVQKAIAAITAAFEKDGSGFRVVQEDELTVFEHMREQYRLYLAAKENYLVLVGNPLQDARAAIDSVLTTESSLTQNAFYQKIAEKLGRHEDIFVYANVKAIVEHNTEALVNRSQQSLDGSGISMPGPGRAFVEDYDAAGVVMNLNTPDFILKSLVTMTSDARSKSLWENVHINKTAVLSMAEHPLLLFSGAINITEYLRLMGENESTNPFQEAFRSFGALSGIDLEAEVFNNLGGNVNMGVYDGSRIAISNYNTLVTFTVNDEQAMHQVLEKAIAHLPPIRRAMISTQTVAGVDAYVALIGFTQVYIGIHNKQVILASGKAMFENALKGEISEGFTSTMKTGDIADTLKNEVNVLYLNVDEVVKAVRNFEIFLQGVVGGPTMMRDIYTAADKLEYLFSTSRLEGNAIATEVQIKTRFQEPFFIEVARMLPKFARE